MIGIAHGLFDRREFVFGKLKPAESKTWTVTVKIPKDWLSRRDGITVDELAHQGMRPYLGGGDRRARRVDGDRSPRWS